MILSPIQITVYERDNPDKKYYFPCNQWLATDEGDGRIVRNLTASTDPKLGRQGNMNPNAQSADIQRGIFSQPAYNFEEI